MTESGKGEVVYGVALNILFYQQNTSTSYRKTPRRSTRPAMSNGVQKRLKSKWKCFRKESHMLSKEQREKKPNINFRGFLYKNNGKS